MLRNSLWHWGVYGWVSNRILQLKSLGVTLDTKLSFDQNVGNIVKASNFNIRALRHIRPMLDRSVANTVACSIVSKRLDYCNSLLLPASASNFQRLQRVQNTLAHVITGTRKYDHIKPVLRKTTLATGCSARAIQSRTDNAQSAEHQPTSVSQQPHH